MQNVILWDWDNTLADSLQAIHHAQNKTRQFFGLSPWTIEETKQSMNGSGYQLFLQMVGKEKVDLAIQTYLTHYQNCAQYIQLKPYARQILTWTKEQNFINILASNKRGNLLRHEVEISELSSLFQKIVGATDCPKDKPDKLFTDYALLGYNPDKIIAIGDGLSDIQMAKNYPNGISILIGQKAPNNAVPDFICPSLSDIKNVFAKKHLANSKKISYNSTHAF